MEKTEDFKTLYEISGKDFLDYIKNVKEYLKKHDKEYKKQVDTITKILKKNKKIQSIMDCKGEIFELTKEDFEDLNVALSLKKSISTKEEKAILYAGIGNAIMFLREIDNFENIYLKNADGGKC